MPWIAWTSPKSLNLGVKSGLQPKPTLTPTTTQNTWWYRLCRFLELWLFVIAQIKHRVHRFDHGNRCNSNLNYWFDTMTFSDFLLQYISVHWFLGSIHYIFTHIHILPLFLLTLPLVLMPWNYHPMSLERKYEKGWAERPFVKMSPSCSEEATFSSWMFLGPICSRNQWYLIA